MTVSNFGNWVFDCKSGIGGEDVYENANVKIPNAYYYLICVSTGELEYVEYVENYRIGGRTGTFGGLNWLENRQ